MTNENDEFDKTGRKFTALLSPWNVRQVLMVIRLWWPDSQFISADTGTTLNPLLFSVSGKVIVYKSATVRVLEEMGQLDPKCSRNVFDIEFSPKSVEMEVGAPLENNELHQLWSEITNFLRYCQ
jgi:hypothetical protein